MIIPWLYSFFVFRLSFSLVLRLRTVDSAGGRPGLRRLVPIGLPSVVRAGRRARARATRCVVRGRRGTRHIRSARRLAAQSVADIVGCRVRQLERACGQRRHPILRRRSASWTCTPTGDAFRTTCCCCRRPCGPDDVPAFSMARLAPSGLRRTTPRLRATSCA